MREKKIAVKILGQLFCVDLMQMAGSILISILSFALLEEIKRGEYLRSELFEADMWEYLLEFISCIAITLCYSNLIIKYSRAIQTDSFRPINSVMGKSCSLLQGSKKNYGSIPS